MITLLGQDLRLNETRKPRVSPVYPCHFTI